MINLSELGYLKDSSNIYRNDFTINFIDKRLSSYDKIYTAVDSLDFQLFLENLNVYGYKIIDVKHTVSCDMLSKGNHFVYIFEIEKDSDFENNEITFNDNISFDINQCMNNNIDMFIGVGKNSNKFYSENYKAVIYGVNSDRKEELSNFSISYNGEFFHYNGFFDTSNYNNIEISLYDLNNKTNESFYATILNFDSKCK